VRHKEQLYTNLSTLEHIIPNHCCVVSNIADSVWLVRDGQVVGEEKVAARGKVI
jgi:D-serine deaminase-like pyridoxal phosphate-dependent protein